MDDDVFEAFRCCISRRKCKGCPRENACPKDNTVTINKALALDVINKLKELQADVDELSFQLFG